MTYVIYGAGAVGGVIAARLRTSGQDVTVVARGDHLAAIRRDGLQVHSAAGVETVPLTAAATAAEVHWAEDTTVLLTVKSQQTAAALDDLAAHAPASIVLVTAQNGVANEAAALRRFANVYGLAVVLAAAHLEPGVVVQQAHPLPGVLDLGRFPSGVDAVAERIAADLRGATFRSVARPDIMTWKYRKLIGNLGNGVDAAFRPGPDADRLIESARAEAEQILALAGIAVVTAEQDEANRAGRPDNGFLRPELRSSTWQSVARGRGEVETDWFNGEIVLTARLHGTTAPVNELIQRLTAEHVRAGGAPQTLDAAGVIPSR